MRVIPLKFGRDELPAHVPDDALVVAPKACTTPALSSAQLADAFAHEGLVEALAGAARIALVVNDQTRKGGMRVTLEAIGALLDRAGIEKGRVDLVVAYGLHSPQTDETSRAIYGEAMLARTRLVHHDGRDPSRLVSIGALRPDGSDRLSLAREVAGADLRVLVGAIGFHYYAGFSGGRKAVLPGVADEASIVRNHLRVLDPSGPGGRAGGCAPARLEGNPVSDEMFAAARLVDAFHGRTFLANAIIGAAPGVAGQVIDVACGLDVESAFRAGCARLVATNAIALPSDDAAPSGVIASAGGWPYDAALYQAHKAYDNAFRALAPRIARGERPPLVFVARCDEGLGHSRFAAWLQHPSRAAHYQALTAGYEIVGQTSLAVRDKAALTRTLAVTDLDADTCAQLGWEKASSLDDAMARAGHVARWGVIPSAGAVLPVAT